MHSGKAAGRAEGVQLNGHKTAVDSEIQSEVGSVKPGKAEPIPELLTERELETIRLGSEGQPVRAGDLTQESQYEVARDDKAGAEQALGPVAAERRKSNVQTKERSNHDE